jgi:hypothetical protein
MVDKKELIIKTYYWILKKCIGTLKIHTICHNNA